MKDILASQFSMHTKNLGQTKSLSREKIVKEIRFECFSGIWNS